MDSSRKAEDQCFDSPFFKYEEPEFRSELQKADLLIVRNLHKSTLDKQVLLIVINFSFNKTS